MITKGQLDGFEVYAMQNDKLAVLLCPSLGNNLFRMWDRIKKRDILRVPPNMKVLQERPIYYGIPVLFPPNRTRYGRFEFQGRVYQLEINWEGKHNNHGFLAEQLWKVASYQQLGNSQSITSTFAAVDSPDVLKQYPHDLFFSMTYELRESTLVQTVSITNRGKAAAPVGFGSHPWYLLDHEPEKWNLQLPVSLEWELDSELMPTGRLMTLGPYESLAKGINLQGQQIEKLFLVGDNPHTATLSRNGYEIRIQTSDLYKHWLIYTGEIADEFICIEPYTWATNAPNLHLPDELTGLIALQHNETIHLTVNIEISYF